MKTPLASDAALVAAMLRGDEAAFRLFFDTYFSRVYRFVLPRVGGDVEAAKEVVQTVLIKAVRGLASFRNEAALFTWLCQIARSQIVDFLRAQRRHTNGLVLIDDSPQLRAVLEAIQAPLTSDPQHSYSVAETRQLIRSVLDRLPARYVDVLEWKYIEGHSVEEIGVMLGIGHTAAQSVLARARTAFRAALDTVFGATSPDVLASVLRVS